MQKINELPLQPDINAEVEKPRISMYHIHELERLARETREMLEIGHLDIVTAKENLDHIVEVLNHFAHPYSQVGYHRYRNTQIHANQLAEDIAHSGGQDV